MWFAAKGAKAGGTIAKQKAAGQTTVQTIDARAARIAERAARGEDAPTLFGIGAK